MFPSVFVVVVVVVFVDVELLLLGGMRRVSVLGLALHVKSVSTPGVHTCVTHRAPVWCDTIKVHVDTCISKARAD